MVIIRRIKSILWCWWFKYIDHPFYMWKMRSQIPDEEYRRMKMVKLNKTSKGDD